jgi:hypothetical protein
VAFLIPAVLGVLVGFALPRLSHPHHDNSKRQHPDTAPDIGVGAGGDHQ